MPAQHFLSVSPFAFFQLLKSPHGEIPTTHSFIQFHHHTNHQTECRIREHPGEKPALDVWHQWKRRRKKSHTNILQSIHHHSRVHATVSSQPFASQRIRVRCSNRFPTSHKAMAACAFYFPRSTCSTCRTAPISHHRVWHSATIATQLVRRRSNAKTMDGTTELEWVVAGK